MFDVKHETNVTQLAAAPDAATKEPPVRIEVGGDVLWIRPSNVLRVTFSKAKRGVPDVVVIVLSDSKEITLSNADATIADAISALLWPK